MQQPYYGQRRFLPSPRSVYKHEKNNAFGNIQMLNYSIIEYNILYITMQIKSNSRNVNLKSKGGEKKDIVVYIE